MSVVSPARLSESAGLLKDRIAYPVIRKAFALSKALGPFLYLVLYGVIAVWVVGVFFGVGLFFLMHRSEKQAIRLGVGDVHLVTLLPESPGVYQSIAGSDRFLPQPYEAATSDKNQTVATADMTGAALNDRQQTASATFLPRLRTANSRRRWRFARAVPPARSAAHTRALHAIARPD